MNANEKSESLILLQMSHIIRPFQVEYILQTTQMVKCESVLKAARSRN